MPQSSSKFIRTIVSGVPELVREVYLSEETDRHIREHHPTEYKRFSDIVQAVEKPTRVHKSKVHPTAVVFVNDRSTSTDGDPLRVPVKVYSDGTGIISTAHFSSAATQGPLLWGLVADEQ
jgi:hypothetical protein